MRLPVPMIAIDGSSNGAEVRRPQREVGALVGDPLREQRLASRNRSWARARARRRCRCDPWLEARKRVVEVLRQGDAVVVVAAQLLRAPDEERAHDVVLDLSQRIANDRRIVLRRR